MSYTAAGILMVAAVAIIIVAALQIVRYRRGSHIITRRQMVLRLIMAALLLLAIVLIFFGLTWPWQDPVVELIFWTSLFIPAIAVIFLAVGDLRQVEKQKHLRRAELYKEMQKLQDMHEKSADDDTAGNDDTADGGE